MSQDEKEAVIGHALLQGGKLAFVLMMKILEMVKDSGATDREALSALKAAEAMIPEMALDQSPQMVIET